MIPVTGKDMDGDPGKLMCGVLPQLTDALVNTSYLQTALSF